MSSESVIACEGMWHIYPGGIEALRNADLEVQAGEILGVVGQNGSGKTTLVKHFNGLLRPTLGSVRVLDWDTQTASVNDLSRHVGYVFQNPNHQLFATSVGTELAFGPKNLGMEEEEIEGRVAVATEFFEIGDVLDIHPYRLSFPLRKLVAMASIYAMGPEIFVLDEPTTGQDHKGSNMVRKLVRRLHDDGRTVIIVSHDMALIAEVAHRVVALWDAEIISVGTAREIFADDSVMERTKLHPPQITEFSRRWPAASREKLALTVEEAVASLLGTRE